MRMFFNKTKKERQNTIIIRMDGGICSQLNFYAVGAFLESKGYIVKYDLSWFKENGMDLDGRFVRNFDLLKAFPSFNITEATDDEIRYFAKHYPKNTNELNEFKPPLYLDKYPSGMSFFVQNRNDFIKNFLPEDVSSVSGVLNDIKSHVSCAIHVRRGDVVENSQNHVYGNPCSIDYFITAIKLLQCLDKKAKFYFFSDEISWVRDNIIPLLKKDIDYELCATNGSDKGYLDLLLISNCDHIIASKGSLGPYGRVLSKSDGWFIGPLKSKYLAKYFDKCVFLNYDHENIMEYHESYSKH